MTDPNSWSRIKSGLEWLTANKHWRDAETEKKEGKAVKYAKFHIKVIGTMRRYPDQAELLKLLQELDYDPELKQTLEPAVEFEVLTEPEGK